MEGGVCAEYRWCRPPVGCVQGGGAFLKHEDPDIICLQETKVKDVLKMTIGVDARSKVTMEILFIL